MILAEFDGNSENLIENSVNFKAYEPEFSQIHSEKRRKEFLVPRILLEQISTEKIAYDSNGKPFLLNSTKKISISHSLHFFAVIVSDFEVGIDIEYSHHRYEKIKHKYLSDKEASMDIMVKNLDLAWSAKETVYKIVGREAANFKDDLEIRTIDPEEMKVYYEKSKKEFKVNYIKNSTFTLSYCIYKDEK